MDAAHGTVGTGQSAAEISFGELLPGDFLGSLKSGLLQVSRGKPSELVQGGDVLRRAQVMVFPHQGGAHSLLVDSIIELSIASPVGYRKRPPAGDHHGL